MNKDTAYTPLLFQSTNTHFISYDPLSNKPHFFTLILFLMTFNISISYEEEKSPVKFSAVAILPKPGDNVAVAINEIPMGSLVELLDGNVVSISHTVLEGHRFAVKKIEENGGLYSWGMQFGTALKTIQPGEYIMNERGRKALSLFSFYIVDL